MAPGRQMYAWDEAGIPIRVDQPVIEGAVSIPRDLGPITPANLAQLVTTVNRVLANQRAFAVMLGLTITES